MKNRGALMIIAIIVLTIIGLIAVGLLILRSGNNLMNEDARICTLEAMQCPDGSYVGRNGANNCEFDECPSQIDVDIDL